MHAKLAILCDARQAPGCFFWFGGLSSEAMSEWMAKSGLDAEAVPSDLRTLWQATGGGDCFESETILGPGGDPYMGDEVIAANRCLQENGKPKHFLAFARGTWLAAVDTRTGEYVILKEGGSWAVRQRFASLDEWYAKTVRQEFAERYGLGKTMP